MPDGFQLSQEFQSRINDVEPIEVADPTVAAGLGDRMPLGVLVDRGRAVLERLRANLDALYGTAVRSDAGPPELLEVAAIIRNKERADTERLQPRIKSVGRKLAARPLRDTEAQDSLQEILDNAVGGLALYRDLYEKLLKLAAERRATAGEILRARPVKGEIDHAALSREFIARFPKIRAALAK
jgi:hypothetical protein